MSTLWLSLHLFYHGDLDELIVQCVRPLVTELHQAKAIDGAFFLRYWNGGPHVRLRLATTQTLCECLLENITARYARFVAARPADNIGQEEYENSSHALHELERRAASRGLGIAEPLEPLQPNNSIQRRGYTFDHSRYGSGVSNVVESHFCSSSTLAMLVTARTLGRLDARMTLALHLGAAGYAVLEVAPDMGARYFRTLAEFEKLAEPVSDRSTIKGTDVRAVAELTHQLEHGLPLIGQHAGVTTLVGLWEEELRSQRRALREIQGAGTSEEILLDYIHLLNNRLGLTISQECCIYSILAGAIQGTDP